MTKTVTRKAWAIHTQSREGHHFIGTGYMHEWRQVPTPPYMTGLTVALFRSRREARAALKLVKGPEWGFKRARVYRVQVDITGRPA